MQLQKVKITCQDRVQLGAILLEAEAPKGGVQFNCGTAAKKEFYLPFCQFLAENGFHVCLWDYRGSGDSGLETLKGCTYEYLDYGTKDMPAVLDFLDEKYPDLPKFIVGHSAGGQQIGFMPNYLKISGLIAIATSVGYWNFMPLSYRIKTLYFFWIIAPITQFLYGYTATKRLGIMEDLPTKVTNDWRDWCSVPAYFFDEKYFKKTVPKGHFHELSFPIQVFWATDDPISNARSVPMYWQHIHSSKGITIESLKPSDFGVKKIDHFGFFRKQFRETLWRKALTTLNNFLATHSTQP